MRILKWTNGNLKLFKLLNAFVGQISVHLFCKEFLLYGF
ncbi:hypothetical protein BLGI_502 [Brevibacillus laterosporus GI-9]|nr:hypothetical protein BLGI_502 [Brevibacillus laterosporus GI-9]